MKVTAFRCTDPPQLLPALLEIEVSDNSVREPLQFIIPFTHHGHQVIDEDRIFDPPGGMVINAKADYSLRQESGGQAVPLE